MNESFWKNKRVLLTGHTGFKGGWLSLWLQMLQAEVVGFSLEPPTEPSLFKLANVEKGMKSIVGDISDSKAFTKVMIGEAPDIVIHMAAQSLVMAGYDNPIETYNTNVMGTANLFEAVRQTDSVIAVVNVTSDKCYENQEWPWGYRENERMGGHDPYSSSKACSELVTESYRKSFFGKGMHPAAVATARAGNAIGGGDWAPNRLIPDFMRAIIANEKVVIRNPRSIRPWQHVLEPLSGYLVLAELLTQENGSNFAEAWNFGPYEQDAMSVESILNELVDFWGEGASWILASKVHRHEATYLKLDCSKAHQKLDWSPKLDMQDNLQWIVEWYKAYLAGEDMRVITEHQISDYVSK